MIEKIVISPLGEDTDGRGQGPVTVEIVGAWANLVGLADPGSSHRVQLGLGEHVQLNPANLSGTADAGPSHRAQLDQGTPVQLNPAIAMWRITATIPGIQTKRSGRFAYNSHVLAALAEVTTEPVTIDQIAERIRLAKGIEPMNFNRSAIGIRIRECLGYHLANGTVRQIVMPGSGSPKGWVSVGSSLDQALGSARVFIEKLPFTPWDRINWRKGQFSDNQLVFDLLASATRPVTTKDFVDCIVLTRKDAGNRHAIRARLAKCLLHHEREGTIEMMLMNGPGSPRSWRLVRTEEAENDQRPSTEGPTR